MNIQRSVEEFSVAKRQGYHTVLIGSEKFRVIPMITDRDKEGLRKYLQEIPDERCHTLFVVDIWKGNINKIYEA